VSDAVDAAGSGDREGFARAGPRLSARDPDQLRRVLSAVLRPLLEDLHPEGVSGDDLRTAVAGCAAGVATWAPVDPQVLVVVVAGAFGIHPQEQERPDVAATQVAHHACLLIAHLLATSGRRLEEYLRLAFAELARSELQDD
jgi:enamine deaminase RidA (YjgF/YER057c/UK114 family)